jgi:hypothetical protein
LAATLLQGLKEEASKQGVRLASIRPWWAAALDAANAEQPGFDLLAVRDGDALVLLAERNGQRLEAMAYDPCPAPEQAEAVVQRRSMALDIATARICRIEADFKAHVPRKGLIPAIKFVSSFANS